MSNVQFPYPRNSPSTPSYTSRNTSSYRQKRALKTYGPPFAAFIGLLWLFVYIFSGSSSTPKPPTGTPPVVIVTTLSPSLSDTQRAALEENRRDYAAHHGYATFMPNTTSYDLMEKTPPSWASVPALRHAMTLYPHTPWFWYLTSTALIMNANIAVDQAILPPKKIESLLIGDQPVVPPDSVIRTFSHLRGERIDLVLTQDTDGLAGGSLLVKSGEWAKFFLDAWFDPLYRTYNFQKAEGHALEHIVQWHGTILSHMALIPQRMLNSYTREVGAGTPDGLYQEGDFVANFHGCQRDPHRNCEEEMAPLMARWKELRDQEHKRR